MYVFIQASLQAAKHFLGPLASNLRIDTRVGPARRLLRFEDSSAVVPVADLLGQAIVDRRGSFVDLLFTPLPDLRQVPRHQLRNGIAARLLLQVTRQPGSGAYHWNKGILLFC